MYASFGAIFTAIVGGDKILPGQYPMHLPSTDNPMISGGLAKYTDVKLRTEFDSQVSSKNSYRDVACTTPSNQAGSFSLQLCNNFTL